MLRKYWLNLCLITISVTLFMVGCSNSPSSGPVTINLYSYGSDNVRIAWEAVIKDFEAAHPDIKVALQFLPSGTGGQSLPERFIAAVKSGTDKLDIDILEMDDNDLTQIVDAVGYESLLTLSEKDIPALAQIPEQSPIANNKATVFRGNTVLLAYNADRVPNPPKTNAELTQWIKDHPGRFAYNDPTTGGSGGSFVLTAIYDFLPEEALTSSDEKWSAQWDQGFAALADLHPHLYKASGHVQYPAKNQGTLDLLAAGSVDIIPAWADMTLDQMARDMLPDNIKMTQIEPALTGGLVSIGIPAKVDPNKLKAAQTFLDFLVSAKGQEILVKSQKIIPVISPTLLSGEAQALLGDFKIEKYRLYSIGALNDLLWQRWQKEIATLN
ncbi:MAG: extracellular solute-binding protein [Deltaproteobacteria bacterium]|jgi:putative spermidine/putrescine transport system substrate-binding protein|nr:extracellular solute-binding protein [Deltaproteobacteria bacterium]